MLSRFVFSMPPESELPESELPGADLQMAELQGTESQRSEIERAEIQRAEIQWADLGFALNSLAICIGAAISPSVELLVARQLIAPSRPSCSAGHG